jgi:hypothetical protein
VEEESVGELYKGKSLVAAGKETGGLSQRVPG